MKRLNQIHLQEYAFLTLLDQANAKTLNLDAKQVEKIRDLSKQGGPRMSTAEEKALREKTLSLLSEEQKKAWDSLVGPPYTRRR